MKILKIAALAAFVFATSTAVLGSEKTDCSLGRIDCQLDLSHAQLDPLEKLSNIFFTRGGAQLNRDAKEQLDRLAVALASGALGNTCLRLVGHADTVGNAQKNMDISWKRANAVFSYLHENLREHTVKFELAAKGEMDPLKTIPTTSGFQRRVHMLIKSCP